MTPGRMVGLVWDDHAQGWRVGVMPAGRIIWIVPMLYSVAIVIGPAGAPGYDDRWDYPDLDAAVRSAVEWDPAVDKEPMGWIRHPRSGRRRENGDPATEVIRP